MPTIRIHASKSYDVRISSGLLHRASEEILSLPRLSEDRNLRSVCIVSDDNVFPLYGEGLTSSLLSAGLRTVPFVFHHGEESKKLSTYEQLVETLAEECFTRSDLLIGLGGGVVGDLAGFAASTMLRGLRLIQFPTTLLAAADASVGGKNGLNLVTGKNMIGSFYQPDLVLCDPDLFATLPESEYRNGCAEIIKYAMLDDPDFCRSLLETPVKEDYEAVVARCVEKKKRYVEQDETDLSLRRMLNFGHTAGHAVETCSGYRIPHGEAVAIGMSVISRAAVAKGYCDPNVPAYLESVLSFYGLPSKTDFLAESLAEAAFRDKKTAGTDVTLILPQAVGLCRPVTVPKTSLADWFRAGGCL